MINFCPAFYNSRSLKDAVTYGSNRRNSDNLNLVNYKNTRASIFFVSSCGTLEKFIALLTNRQHELCHLDLAANTPSPNPEILDLFIGLRESEDGRKIAYTAKAYGPIMTKILARWHQKNIGSNTGNFVQTNSDNFAMFSLAKYVQKKLGNVYPNLPLVVDIPIKALYRDPISPYIAQFIAEGDEFYLNTTDSILTLENDWGLDIDGDEAPGCSDPTNSDPLPPISIDGFTPASAYPD